jgi:serine protease AprX
MVALKNMEKSAFIVLLKKRLQIKTGGIMIGNRFFKPKFLQLTQPLGAIGLSLSCFMSAAVRAQTNDLSSTKEQIQGQMQLTKTSHVVRQSLTTQGDVHGFRGRTTPIRVYLKEKADLTQIPVVLTEKAARGKWVYNSLRLTAQRSQKSIRAFLDGKKIAYEPFYIVNMIAIPEATSELIGDLERFETVDRIRSDKSFVVDTPVPLETEENTKNFRGLEGSIVATGAPTVWDTYDAMGQGVVVAGQDTGVDYQHPALKNQYRGFTEGEFQHDYNWYDAVDKPLQSGSNPCGFSSAEPCDDDTHGTHTMGTVVGDDGAQEKIGMAPHAKWIACRNMDRGLGQPSTYIKCFEFFLAPFPRRGQAQVDGKPELAPDVINNSWGCPQEEGCDGQEMRSVLEALYVAGISTVVSAGNAGPSCGTINDQPATHSDLTLTVGAYNHRNQQIANFSSRGPSILDQKVGPDLTAPGVGIRSSVPGGSYAGGYSGTSMAGPHVAGAVALLISARPALRGNPARIFDALTGTATPMTSAQSCGGLSGSKVPNNTFGSGLLNVLKAVESVP